MKSIRELYRIGVGPSSSHTMGPKRAAELFLQQYTHAASYVVHLYESLAATGKGHLTDKAVLEVLGKEYTQVQWHPEKCLPQHPNAMTFEAYDAEGTMIGSRTFFSVGGGAICELGEEEQASETVYPYTTIETIMEYCAKKGITYWEYVVECEGESIFEFLETVWETMENAVTRGLETQGVLPGSIGLSRQAWRFYRRCCNASNDMQQTGLITAYALAVSEENAGGGIIVTAPTCGACGVLPATLYYMQQKQDIHHKDILKALATAGLFGNVIKFNGSISGAEVGCQGEVGSACAMAAGATAELLGGTLRQIEYAAEMGLEHHLGLTCDPVDGLVQIPCIERNACAATRALSCAQMAILSDGTHHIPFDEVVHVMTQTGHDLPSLYRETSTGGLAKAYAGRKGKE